MSLGEVEELPGRDQDAVQWVRLQSLEAWTFDEDQGIDDASSDDIALAQPGADLVRTSVDGSVDDGGPEADDVLPQGWIEARIDARSPVDGHCYATTAQKARERLDAMGFTLARASSGLAMTTVQFKRELDESVTRLRAQIEDVESESPAVLNLAEYPPNMRTMLARAAAQRAAVDRLEINAWQEAFRWIAAHGAHALDTTPDGRDPSWGRYYVRDGQVTPLIAYLLEEQRNHKLGFSHDEDIRCLWRAALEACAPDAAVMLDLSSITGSGRVLAEDTLVADAHATRRIRIPSDAPTVVLTEGPSDRAAIEGALALLAPHLTDLYTFMDFESMRVEGGARPLVGLVKAFAGARIVDRVVAIFDNDTAAQSALRGLRQVALPSNIRVANFPNLAVAERYPTQGPHGEQVMNVNGQAGSIELYFGEDVLRHPTTGQLTPVRWSSLDRGTQQYQCELLDKHVLQQRFDAKLRAARRDPSVMTSQDWSGMQAVIDTLRRAFLSVK